MNTLNSNSGQRYHAGERVTDPMKTGGGGGGVCWEGGEGGGSDLLLKCTD